MTHRATEVTETAARKVLAALVAQRPLGVKAGSKPQLVKDWYYMEDTFSWAVVWEEGPSCWPYAFPGGGHDEELAYLLAEAAEEFGLPLHVEDATIKPVTDLMPPDVFCEAVNPWAVAIYPL